MISGLITIVAFASFIGISVWAWSRSNRDRFVAAAKLPLDDERAVPSCCRKGEAP